MQPGERTRITALAAALLLCAGMLLAMRLQGASGGAGQEGWPLFRGDGQQTGRARGKPPAAFRLAWTFSCGGGISSTAAVWNRTAYVGCLDGYLYALDLETGRPRWKFKADGEIHSSPSIHRGTLYFGDDAGTFHALAASDGARRWSFKTGGKIVSGANFTREGIVFGSYDQQIYCLSRSGKVLWKATTDGYINATPAVAGDRIAIAGCDGNLRLLRARDGSPLWILDLGSYIAASPAIHKGRVYLGTFENQILAVGLETGKLLWRYEHPQRKFPYYASAAVDDRLVVVGGRDKMVHGLDPASGRELWSFAGRAAVDASATMIGDRVLVANKAGEIFLLDSRSGLPVWQFDAGAPIEASPVYSSGRLVVGTMDGSLHGFAAQEVR